MFVATGRWVGLRLPIPPDALAIRDIETAGIRFARYRHRAVGGIDSAQPSHPGALLQLIAVPLSDPRQVVAVVTCYGADFRNRWAKVAVVTSTEVIKTAMALDGLRAFVTYLFAQFDFRKLYADVLAPNLESFRSALHRGPFVEEGVLRDHEFLESSYVDLHILSVTRAEWASYIGSSSP